MSISRTFFAVFVFCCASSLPSPQAAYCQDFSSIDTDLQQLEHLIADTLSNSEAQQKLLDDLKQNLDASGNLIENYESVIAEQEQLCRPKTLFLIWGAYVAYVLPRLFIYPLTGSRTLV